MNLHEGWQVDLCFGKGSAEVGPGFLHKVPVEDMGLENAWWPTEGLQPKLVAKSRLGFSHGGPGDGGCQKSSA